MKLRDLTRKFFLKKKKKKKKENMLCHINLSSRTSCFTFKTKPCYTKMISNRSGLDKTMLTMLFIKVEDLYHQIAPKSIKRRYNGRVRGDIK